MAEDSLFELGVYPRAAKLFALTLGPRKPSTDSFLNHRALELGEDAHDLKHGLAGWRRGVETLLMQKKVNANCVNFG